MRSTCAAASAGSSAVSSRSIKRPTRVPDDVETELAQRVANGVTLRIEDAVLRTNHDNRLHRTTSGFARYASNEISVSRSNASM